MSNNLTREEEQELLTILDRHYEISVSLEQRGLECLLERNTLLAMTVQREREYIALREALQRELEY